MEIMEIIALTIFTALVFAWASKDMPTPWSGNE